MNEITNEGKNPSQKIKPALLPIKCVLCDGWGTFSYGKTICNGCGGKGYILVPAQKEGGAK